MYSITELLKIRIFLQYIEHHTSLAKSVLTGFNSAHFQEEIYVLTESLLNFSQPVFYIKSSYKFCHNFE